MIRFCVSPPSRPRAPVLPVMMLLLSTAACHQSRPGGATTVPGGDPARGQAFLAAYGCGACHTIPGVRGANGLVGPPLTSFGDRAYIAGRLTNEPQNLVRWISDPQAVDSQTAMPDVGVAEATARDMAAYLYTLGDGSGLGPRHLLPRRWLEALTGGD